MNTIKHINTYKLLRYRINNEKIDVLNAKTSINISKHRLYDFQMHTNAEFSYTNLYFNNMYIDCFVSFQARLNELTSQIRLQNQGSGSPGRAEGRYSMDLSLQDELKQVGLCHSSWHLLYDLGTQIC